MNKRRVKTHRELILEIGNHLTKEEVKAGVGDWRTERSSGFAAISRHLLVGREVVSRWASANKVPRWWWEKLESLNPKIKPGSFKKSLEMGGTDVLPKSKQRA